MRLPARENEKETVVASPNLRPDRRDGMQVSETSFKRRTVPRSIHPFCRDVIGFRSAKLSLSLKRSTSRTSFTALRLIKQYVDHRVATRNVRRSGSFLSGFLYPRLRGLRSPGPRGKGFTPAPRIGDERDLGQPAAAACMAEFRPGSCRHIAGSVGPAPRSGTA